MSPEVSYLVVCFNSQKHITKCIDSILNQSHKNNEIIVIDNDSGDNTVAIVDGFCRNNPKIKLIKNLKNMGYGNALTTGIENSKGEYLVVLNADIVLEEKWTSILLDLLKKDEKIMAVSGKILFPDGHVQSTGGLMDKYGAVIQRGSKLFDTGKIKDQASFFYNDGSSFMIKRKIFEQIYFDPKLFLYYEDVDLSWKIRMLNYRAEYSSEAICYHDLGHSLSDVTLSKFYYIIRNRIYICLKNYSGKNIISRTPKMLILIFLVAIYYDLHKKPTGYTKLLLKALWWNMTNLTYTLREHKKMLSIKKTSDSELDRYIIKNSIEFSLLKNM